MRIGALTNGEFLREVEEVCHRTGGELVLALAVDISPAERASIMAQFNAGRVHVTFYWITKLAYLIVPPWSLFGLCHHTKQVVDRFLDICLASTHTHPKMVLLNTEPLRTEAVRWRESPDMFAIFDCAALVTFVASLFFALTSDRVQETPHAEVQRIGRHACNHSAAYINWMRREQGFSDHLEQCSTLLQVAAKLCRAARNFEACVRSLGLHKHPALPPGRSWRNPLNVRIVYHEDAFSLYTMGDANIEFRGPGDDPSNEDLV